MARQERQNGWCVYYLKKRNKIQRIGKGPYYHSEDDMLAYLENRYGKRRYWTNFSYVGPFYNEEDAYDVEDEAIERYKRGHGGKLPPYNRARGGGGGRSEY